MKTSFVLMTIGLLVSCRNKDQTDLPVFMPAALPSTIKSEHESLLKTASTFTVQNDTSSKASQKFLELLNHHFTEEEEYVLPALGILPLLANNQMPEDANRYRALIKRFEKNTSHISAEHQFIKVFLDELKSSAPKERIREYEIFEKSLGEHAGREEEIYFPAVILIGKYLEKHSTNKN